MSISKAISVNEYHAKSFEVIDIPLDEIKDDEILVKVSYVPLIHYDLMKLSGITNAQLPYIPCVELSGIVEKSHNKDLIGKKVALTSLTKGTLQSRIIVKTALAVFLKEDSDLIKGSIMSCNPLTAIGVVDTAIELNTKAFALTAANSNCGIQIYNVAKKRGIDVISIVRSEKRVEELKSQGQKYVIDSSSISFIEDLNSLMIKLEANVLFDCLSGPITGKLMKALPKKGIFVNFGTQTHLPMSDIDATDFRWGFKKMTSFLVGPWVEDKISKGTFDEFKNFIRENQEIFESEPGKVFSVLKLKEAVEYAESKDDGLKVVLDMSDLN